MIKLEHVVLASPEQMEFIIEGMRNSMNSWDKSDSWIGCSNGDRCDACNLVVDDPCPGPLYILGDNDRSLMQRLANAGTDHRKFMRMIPVYVRITAPLYWWKEFDTYKVGTVANSCSTMHKIQDKEFTLEDFSTEHLGVTVPAEKNDEEECYQNLWPERMKGVIETLNIARGFYIRETDPELKKDYWWQMIQLLPSSYNQTRNVMMNYEVLANIYKSRKDHKLDEWREFCKWIEGLPFHELITEIRSSEEVSKMTKEEFIGFSSAAQHDMVLEAFVRVTKNLEIMEKESGTPFVGTSKQRRNDVTLLTILADAFNKNELMWVNNPINIKK